jgi:hypothetical protein
MNEDRIKEAVKKALMKDEANEELVGGQKKLDANGDGEISGKDFELLRAKKGMKEADDKTRGTVVLPAMSNPMDIKKLTDQGVDVELRKEDLDLGHEDNEPHMIKGELYRIGKYAMELYQMVDQFEYGYGEVDFPAWWQAKITTAMNNMVSAKHYLDFELKEPEIDVMVGVASTEEVIDEEKISAEEKLAALITKALKNVANKDVSDQSNLKQARAALNKGNMDAAKKIADPYLEEGLPKGYFAKNTPGGKMEESNVNESFLAVTSKRVIKDENLDSFISKMEDAGYKLAKMLGPEDNLYKDHPIIDHTWKYGLPKFNNLLGPMRDGDRFRYEDQETYDRMSLEESYDALVKKIKGQGKSEKAAKAIAGAVASYKAKGGGKGPTAKQKG